MANLFPVFEVPSVLAETLQVSKTFRPGPSFDTETGEFQIDGSGKMLYSSGYDAWILWCTKTISTQRWAHLGYSSGVGIEMTEAFAQPDRQAQQSYFQRTVTEALLADPKGRNVRVYDFSFSWCSETLEISFQVLGANGDTASIETEITT